MPLVFLYSAIKSEEINKNNNKKNLLVSEDMLIISMSPISIKAKSKDDIFRLGDFEDVIKEFDSPTTYFYLDPPYWKTENYYSNHDFDRDDHERLAYVLKTIEGKFSLSYYDFTELGEMYPLNDFKWEKKEFVKASGAKEGQAQSIGEEVLIMNYKP